MQLLCRLLCLRQTDGIQPTQFSATERKRLRHGDFSDKTFIKRSDRIKLNPLVAVAAHSGVRVNVLHYLTYLLKISVTCGAEALRPTPLEAVKKK